MTDLLRMDYINSLPQPFIARFSRADEWPVYDIDVQTGMMRIDVCGRLEIRHFGEVTRIRDIDGGDHDPDDWYEENTHD